MKYGARLVRRTKRWAQRFSYGGLALGTLFYCFSLMPSLLPRPWFFQGILSGISLAIGYGLGTGFSSLVRWLFQRELPASVKESAWRGLAIIAPAFALLYLWLGYGWQNQVRELVGEPPYPSRHFILTLITSLLIGLLLLYAGRGLRRLGRFTQRQIDKLLPRRVSYTLAGVLMVAFVIWVVSGVFGNFFFTVTDKMFAQKNNTTAAGINQPKSPDRSGSPESYAKWDTLGYQGRTFVARGPNVKQLSEFSGQPAKETIRVYAGLESADDSEARAQLVVKELERTHAFDRKVLLIANTTGTGWLEPQSIDTLEYMYNGDTAIAAMQYSYLPSWISFLVDKDKATENGRNLFDAVYGAWAKLPADHRPKLYTYGLSLGSFGGQAAFSGVNGMRNTVDGALLVGTPNDTELWRNVTTHRDPGSPEWQPVYQGGVGVRFAATNQDINASQEKWQQPRILYVQHGSDPIVWFNFANMFHEPDWLREPRAPDVSPNVTWYPFVTFWQITIDQIFGVQVPAGHGHNYGNTAAASWAAVTQPEGWTDEKSQKLQKIIDSYAIE